MKRTRIFRLQVKDALFNTAHVFFRELELIFQDWGVMIIIFAVPLLYPVLYSFIYYPEVVREMPVTVVDLSQSSDSRTFIRNLDNTPELKVISTSISMEDAVVQFNIREIRGIVLLPNSYADDLALHRQTTISAYADMEYFLYYKALMTGCSFVALETGNQLQIKNLINSGLTGEQATILAEPLHLVDNAMANPAGGFASYGIPAALILIIQQTLVLAIGILAGTARERHRNGILLPPDKKRRGIFRLILGKSAAYFVIYAMLCVYMLGIIPHWFGYPHSADFIGLTSLIVPFLLSGIFMGIALSVLFKDRESAMMLYLFTSIPLLFLSGIIWPLSNFTPFWLGLREIFPSSNAIFGFIKMNSLGATISETSKEIFSLWVQAGIYFMAACLVYAVQIKNLNNSMINHN